MRVRRILAWCLFFILMTIAARQQYFLFLNWDIAYLSQCANKMLHGGKYYTDFIEINPPMIVFLYMPPVLLSSFFHVSLIMALKSYFFLVGLLSFFICYFLLGRVFLNEKQWAKDFLALVVVFLFFIFPSYSFGQREHLTTLLVLPYLLLATLRVERRQISFWWCIIIGIFGGIGFSIKPHFLIVFVMLELYLMLKKKDFFYWIRTEALCVVLVVFLYLCAIFVFTPEYVFKVLPLDGFLYFGALSTIGWPVIFKQIITFVLLVSLGVYLVRREKMIYWVLGDVLAISSIGFYFVYLLQHVFWYYHQIPTLSFSVLLCALVAFENFKHRDFEFVFVLFSAFCLFAIILFSLLMNESYSRWFMSKKVKPMVALVERLNIKRSVYVFSSVVSDTYPWVVYAKIQPASRITSFIVLAQLSRQSFGERKKEQIIQMVLDDFEKNKPSLVMVDVRKEKPYFTAPFDYLSFFLKSAQFRQVWKKYKYVESYDGYDLYQDCNCL